MRTTLVSLAIALSCFVSLSAFAQQGVYECVEANAAACAEFTTTNAEHLAAGRATLFFGRYRAVGSRESLGRSGDAIVTLFEAEPGFFTQDGSSCAGVPNLVELIDLLPAGPVQTGQNGTLLIVNNDDGPDLGILDINSLTPNATFTIVMTQSAAPNSLPSYLVAEFTTNAFGNANVVVALELVNAYIGANPSRDQAPQDGIPDGPNAGAVANGAITISMDFVRIYAADGNANVFGTSADELSGAVRLVSERIPDEIDFGF